MTSAKLNNFTKSESSYRRTAASYFNLFLENESHVPNVAHNQPPVPVPSPSRDRQPFSHSHTSGKLSQFDCMCERMCGLASFAAFMSHEFFIIHFGGRFLAQWHSGMALLGGEGEGGRPKTPTPGKCQIDSCFHAGMRINIDGTT